ncbi:hypothetical protein [Nonomuraea aridisoli]|nr:hypothetical protein [Nonomuraea aridisoli]
MSAIRRAGRSRPVPGRRLFVDRLTPEELDRFADIATKILDGLQAEQPAT